MPKSATSVFTHIKYFTFYNTQTGYLLPHFFRGIHIIRYDTQTQMLQFD